MLNKIKTILYIIFVSAFFGISLFSVFSIIQYENGTRKLKIFQKEKTFRQVKTSKISDKRFLWIGKASNSNSFISMKFGDTSLRIKDVVTNKENNIPLNLDSLENISIYPHSFSPDAKKILMAIQHPTYEEYGILNLKDQQIKRLFELTKNYYEAIKWDLKNPSLLYGLRNNILYRIDLEDPKEVPMISDHIEDFLGQEKNMFYITSSENISTLHVKTIAQSNEVLPDSSTLELPPNSKYEFSKDQFLEYNYLSLKERNKSQILLVLFHSKNNTLENSFIQKRAKNIIFLDSENFIYQDDFEITSFNIVEDTYLTRERISSPIVFFGQVFQKGNFYYSTENTIYSLNVESGQKEKKILFSSEGIKFIFTDEKKQKLFVYMQTAIESGLYEIYLQ